MRALLPVLFATLWTLPALGQSYLAINRLDVVPLTRGIWCAAADYTRRTGRDGPQKRLYVMTPRGPSKTRPGATAVAYTLAPDERLKNTPASYSVSVRREGENLPVHHAYNFCDVIVDDLLDRF